MKKQVELSVALFAYNQERYIREAVRGLLYQETSVSLEIVLSDDRSTDRTFAIMIEEVESYDGPHHVVLRQNESNVGLAEHINVVLGLCSAQWVMMAAGDDVSLPTRCEKLLRLISEVDGHGVLAIQGGYFETDPDGEVRSEVAAPPLPSGDLKAYVNDDAYVVGATMVYNMRLFREFPSLQSGVRYEDRVFAFRALLLGKIINHAEALVYYRRDVPTSLSTGDRRGRSLNEQVAFRARRYGGLRHVAAQYLLDMNAACCKDESLKVIIQQKCLEYSFFEAIYETKLVEALKQMRISRKAGHALERPWYWLCRSFYFKVRNLLSL